MTTPNVNASRFAGYFWLALAMFVILAATFTVYVWTEKLIGRANQVRHQSFLLADELRQSSDDLSRTARTYVATGDPVYRRHFQEIIDIRDGRAPRPLDYSNVYWDLVQRDGRRPRPSGDAVPLLDLMRAANLAEPEFAKLAEAKANSDALARSEQAAMALVEPGAPADAEKRARAIALLHDDAYHRAKADVMRPIGEFRSMVDRRTAAAVRAAETDASLMRAAFVVLGLLLVTLLLSMKRKLNAILGATVSELHARITRLARGDLPAPIPVPAGMENSVSGWLAEMQASLARLDARRCAAEQRSRRLTQLYAALSHCSQAIVRCTSQQELFDQICRCVVIHGGMTMAWIGLVDEARAEVRAAACYGSGTEYLNGLRISLDPADPSSRGPIGTAFREGDAYWCRDFVHDPKTLPWREQGKRFGWAASAAIPLRRDGAIVGFLNPYSAIADPFDEEVCALYLEMAADLDFALKNFEREAQRAQAEAALRASEHRLRTVFDTEPECVKLIDRNGQLVDMNRAGLEMLELETLEEAQQAHLFSFLLPEYRMPFADLHNRVMHGQSGMLEFKLKGARGTERVLETHAAPLRDANGEIGLLGITRDVTARKQADERIQYLAHFDALTGLPNRAQLKDLAKYALSLAQRSHEPVALMFLDLDNFKDINDSLGHSVGDTLLVELSERLRQAVREQDTVARMGGDEFMFLLFGVDAQDAGQVAQKLLDAVDGPYRIERHELNVSGSIGIALYPDDGADFETLFQRADAAMYRVKQEGRHGYRFFTSEMQAGSARHLQLVNGLRQALERGQLQIHYQPQLSLQDGSIVGAEALLRWDHPEMGPVSPAEFIPAAEGSGLILPIGEWVLRHAVRQAKAWLDSGLPPLVMAVNLSAVQFRNADLPKLVTRILEQEGLPQQFLELELTEGVAMHDPQGAIAVMNDLHERGVRMSIDDFGTGYSSLSQLKKFKVYKLKIDQSFVRDICTDPEDRAIVGAIIRMAQGLGLHTIAEGVETADQLAFLRQQGCHEMQGYYFSKPLPADRFEAFYREKTTATA